MGLHPNAGWRSFKTDKKLANGLYHSSAYFVYAGPLLSLVDSVFQEALTDFGKRVIGGLRASSVLFIRFKGRQIEIFIPEELESWELYHPQILEVIAWAHSEVLDCELEVRDMSGGGPSWRAYPLEELEEMEEFDNSFAAH